MTACSIENCLEKKALKAELHKQWKRNNPEKVKESSKRERLKPGYIDHIVPVSSFDLTDLGQQKKCFGFQNLQPLWAIDNLSKGTKIGWGLHVNIN